jgi:hypothetical protein
MNRDNDMNDPTRFRNRFAPAHDYDPLITPMDPCYGRDIDTPDDMRQAIGDQAKEGYHRATQHLAGLHYRLAGMAAAGDLDHRTAMDLQHELHEVWQWLYHGTLSAVRDYNTPGDDHWDHDDEHYSDGTSCRTRVRVGPRNHPDNCHVLGEAAVCEYPAARCRRFTPDRASQHRTWAPMSHDDCLDARRRDVVEIQRRRRTDELRQLAGRAGRRGRTRRQVGWIAGREDGSTEQVRRRWRQPYGGGAA